MDVAAHILATEGTAALTVRRLARDVGTSTMSLYTNFSGKEDLIEAVAGEFVVRISNALQAVPTTDDALFDFIELANAYRSLSLDNGDLYRVAMVSGRLSINDDQPRGIKAMFDYCTDRLKRCIKEGLLPNADPRSPLPPLWSVLHGQVTLELEKVFRDAQTARKTWRDAFSAALIGFGADRQLVERCFRKSLRSRARAA